MFKFGDGLETPLAVMGLENAFNLASDYVRVLGLGMPCKIHEDMAECHRSCVDLYCKVGFCLQFIAGGILRKYLLQQRKSQEGGH